jgi:hypothetical protein
VLSQLVIKVFVRALPLARLDSAVVRLLCLANCSFCAVSFVYSTRAPVFNTKTVVLNVFRTYRPHNSVRVEHHDGVTST